MGNILNQPITEKTIHSFTFEGNQGVIVSMQGWRTSMEVDFDCNADGVGCARFPTGSRLVAPFWFFWCV